MGVKARRGSGPADHAVQPPYARPGQNLVVHLDAVATGSADCAATWGREHAYVVGLLHDLGKFRLGFQQYLPPKDQWHLPRDQQTERNQKVSHSTSGALHLLNRYRQHSGLVIDRFAQVPAGVRAMMLAILSHHGQLPDQDGFERRLGFTEAGGEFPGGVEYSEALAASPPSSLLDHPIDWTTTTKGFHPLYARMLLSALVDADVNDSSGRLPVHRTSFADLKASFDRSVSSLPSISRIDQLRGLVLQACLAKATGSRGCYSLDAPTGFGKTLGSLGFGLSHAIHHRMDRLIYVAPFLTAIEQSAGVIRAVLGVQDEALDDGGVTVLEHHSTAERDAARRENSTSNDERTARDQLRENWEAPIIVTSYVQFLESLHAHDRRRCRKLHRYANAVIVMDEPQSIPIELFSPTLNSLRALTRDFGVTIVFVTATQPAFSYDQHRFPEGFKHIEPILPNDLLLEMQAAAASRIVATIAAEGDEVTIDDVAAEIAREPRSTLCIVNTRAIAAELYHRTTEIVAGATPVMHLSASMCSDHRSDVIRAIRGHLDAGRIIKVVSTQVVEAGIDITFPVVMRSFAGLDSLIQSAGRCNRDGKLADLVPSQVGSFRVFRLQDGIPALFRQQAAITSSVLRRGGGMLDPATIAAYYRELRSARNKGERLRDEQLRWNFTTVGTEYRLIEPTMTVVVPYGQRGRAKVRRLLALANGSQPIEVGEHPFVGLNG